MNVPRKKIKQWKLKLAFFCFLGDFFCGHQSTETRMVHHLLRCDLRFCVSYAKNNAKDEHNRLEWECIATDVVQSLSVKWIRRKSSFVQVFFCSVFFYFLATSLASLRSNFPRQLSIWFPLPLRIDSGSFSSNDCLLFCSSIESVTAISCIRSSVYRCVRFSYRLSSADAWDLDGLRHGSACSVVFTAKGSLKPIFRNLWTLSVPLNRIWFVYGRYNALWIVVFIVRRHCEQ